MSSNAQCQILNARYEHKELVICGNFQYDQRAGLALELLKAVLVNKSLTERIGSKGLVAYAYELENAFYLKAVEKDMIVELPMEIPKKD
jgi:hypothetical protein